MDFEKLIAYQKAFDNAMMIFEISNSFPKEETYYLTDRIRRSSRSVAANISEANRKRRYPKHFISKLTDSDAENSETAVWLNFAIKCGYVPKQDYDNAYQNTVEIGKLIDYMTNNPDKFGSSKP